MAEQQSNINPNPNQATIGLITEQILQQINPGMVTYALNAQVQNFDGNTVTYQNEQANESCIPAFPNGYQVIGKVNITQIKRVIYFLTNGTNSQIGYTDNDSCTYNMLLNMACLNFSLDNPIHKVEVKTTNCSNQIYWTDNYNPPRWLDIDKALAGEITDCNQLLVQPNFEIPIIKPLSVEVGGTLKEGTYQFAIQYANALGEGYTSFYGVTNPLSIFLDSKISPNFDEVTSKAINLQISNLDTSGLYDYFNLAVIRTVNGAALVELVGTYDISNSTYDFIYTGTEVGNQNIKLTFQDIFERRDYYDRAGDLTQVDDVLVWADLVKEEDKSYQKIWNQVKVGWEAWQLPTTISEGYHNGANTSELRGLMGDEVYALEGVFFFKNGKISSRCHIPGRASLPGDFDVVSNSDAIGASNDVCHPVRQAYKWQIYNTATVDGTSPGYDPNNDCYKGPYKFGKFGYWESIKRYPQRPDIWGPLAGQLIKHHKVPDSSIIQIHDQNPNGASDAYMNYQHFVYPIGIKVDVQSLTTAIQNSPDLTQEEKDNIVGFKILRGNRANHKSVVAKGLLYNCGEYTKEGTTYMYPNYPYNDLNPDPYLSSVKVNDKAGSMRASRLKSFHNERLTFHSPDTHHYQPSGIPGGYLKLETVESGYCKAHFVPVEDNARQKLLTNKVAGVALAGGVSTVLGVSFSLGFPSGFEFEPRFEFGNFFPTFNTVMDLMTKMVPYKNYGWQYNSVGYYGTTAVVPNAGNKIRPIDFGGYIYEGLQGTHGDPYASINNSYRESSVYLKTGGAAIPFPHQQGGFIDNSRVIASEVGKYNSSGTFFRNISSYYGAIKRYLPAQWGDIFSYDIVDTGFYAKLRDINGNWVRSVDTVFGGDVYITPFAIKRKHSFFNKNTVGKPDGTDVDYDIQGNVGYPIYYYSTSDIIDNVDLTALTNATNTFINVFPAWWNILLGGMPTIGSAINVMAKLLNTGVLKVLGLKKSNMDTHNWKDFFYELGQAYLFAYGIPHFWCESEVNTDMRQAYNIAEGDFCPRRSTDIPDDWLQEKNVPIVQDNTYTYNKTYSKQNKETFYNKLRPDYDPNNPCFTVFNNRAIWSDKSSQEETKNNWLVYRPAARHDFPKAFGKLVGVDRLDGNAVLVRFENKSQIYNAVTTIQASNLTVALGNDKLFSAPPIDLSDADTGSAGSQNKFILHTDFGHVYIDAKRGQVLLLSGTKVIDLAEKGMDKWFAENLPFKILETYPDYPIDNHFNDVGITGVYDPLYKRLIITKHDFIPREEVATDTGRRDSASLSIVPRDEEVPIKYPPTPKITAECVRSWTLSYSFLTNSWTSFHSYIPNYYIGHEKHFQTGINGSVSSLWNHNTQYTKFNNFYGVNRPYVLEYPFAYKYNDEILQNVRDYTTVLKYQSRDIFTEPDETIYFNKAIIGNNQQNSGLLHLIAAPANNLFLKRQYPKYFANYKEILVTKSGSFFNYNMFWDLVKDPNNPVYDIPCGWDTTDRTLIDNNLDYTNARKKYPIRGKELKIRHILDNRNDVKLISKFIISPTMQSYK